jgi:hypothetical protein
MRPVFILLFLLLFPVNSMADLVKPALIEINVEANGNITIEARASIEALLTGINGRYKNTKDAPNAAEYDNFRAMQSEQLAIPFEAFKYKFEQQVKLTNQTGRLIPLQITKVDIPERGYIKVPRISIITLTAKLPPNSQSLQWYYPLSFGDNAVRLRQIDKEKGVWHWSEWQWIRKDIPSSAFFLNKIEQRRPVLEVVKNYIELGFVHIFPRGMDHILFILALFFFSARLRPLLLQVTMFTLAHTLTLGLSVNGIISLPVTIVQPLIALSIAYAGFENIFANVFDKELHKSRLLLVFAFGLLHGIGFASALSDFGMPKDAFFTALISFNIGVELGQLCIIFVAFFALSLWFHQRPWYRIRIIIPASLLIGLIGLYWTFDRLQLFDSL